MSFTLNDYRQDFSINFIIELLSCKVIPSSIPEISSKLSFILIFMNLGGGDGDV